MPDTTSEVAKTYRSYHDFTDPMLRAAAAEAGGLGADTLRWMGYADQELARLRRYEGLPLRPGYALGRPQYKRDEATVERPLLDERRYALGGDLHGQCVKTARAEAAARARDEATCREALARLVALKDGPRDEAYERGKPLAWDQARAALTAAQGGEEACCATCGGTVFGQHEQTVCCENCGVEIEAAEQGEGR